MKYAGGHTEESFRESQRDQDAILRQKGRIEPGTEMAASLTLTDLYKGEKDDFLYA